MNHQSKPSNNNSRPAFSDTSCAKIAANGTANAGTGVAQFNLAVSEYQAQLRQSLERAQREAEERQQKGAEEK
jgi:hypothetical protein